MAYAIHPIGQIMSAAHKISRRGALLAERVLRMEKSSEGHGAVKPLELFDHVYHKGETKVTLVLLHGHGEDKAAMIALSEMVAPGASYLALEGSVFEGEKRRYFHRWGPGIYDMGDLAKRTDALAQFLEAAVAEYNIDNAHAVGFGYCNGANILTNLVLTGQNKLLYAVLMRPLIPFMVDKWPDLSTLKVLMTGGRHDAICPAPWTRTLGEGFEIAGADIDVQLDDGGHDRTGAEISAAKQFIASI